MFRFEGCADLIRKIRQAIASQLAETGQAAENSVNLTCEYVICVSAAAALLTVTSTASMRSASVRDSMLERVEGFEEAVLSIQRILPVLFIA